MHTDKTTEQTAVAPKRSGARMTVLVTAATLIIMTFFAAYAYASSQPAGDPTACIGDPLVCEGDPLACEDPAVAAAADGAACEAGCCGSGQAGPVTQGESVIEGDVQRVSVDVSQGYFNPGEIVLQAGVPVEITFSEGRGCLAEVMFEQFGILEDLTSGGAVVSLPALEPGTYEFSCGMRMVFGQLVVR